MSIRRELALFTTHSLPFSVLDKTLGGRRLLIEMKAERSWKVSSLLHAVLDCQVSLSTLLWRAQMWPLLGCFECIYVCPGVCCSKAQFLAFTFVKMLFPTCFSLGVLLTGRKEKMLLLKQSRKSRSTRVEAQFGQLLNKYLMILFLTSSAQ